MAAELEPRLRPLAARRAARLRHRPDRCRPRGGGIHLAQCGRETSDFRRHRARRHFRTRRGRPQFPAGPGNRAARRDRERARPGARARDGAGRAPRARRQRDPEPQVLRAGRPRAIAVSRAVRLCGAGPRLAADLARRRQAAERRARHGARRGERRDARGPPRRENPRRGRGRMHQSARAELCQCRPAAGRRARADAEPGAMMHAGGHRRRDRGFIIVAVLWIVLALATFASIYAAYVVRTADAVGSSDRQVRAQALFTAALELTAYQLTTSDKDKRPPTGRFNFRMGRATVLVDFGSEAGRIDLNAAPKPMLASLFATLGARPADADLLADHVIAWRSAPAQTGEGDTEAEAYRVAGLNYAPRHAPFQDVGELWLGLLPR